MGECLLSQITDTLRDAILGYLTTDDDDYKLLCFNKLVTICTSNSIGLTLPSRTVGFGLRAEKTLRDSPINDFAQEFVLGVLRPWLGSPLAVIEVAVESRKFDFMPHRFKSRVMNKIRDIKRSHEEDWVEPLPDEGGEDLYDGCE